MMRSCSNADCSLVLNADLPRCPACGSLPGSVVFHDVLQFQKPLLASRSQSPATPHGRTPKREPPLIPAPPMDTGRARAARTNNLIACFSGCVIASLVDLNYRIRFDVGFFGLVSVTFIPALACRIAGITDKTQLAKIAVYAIIGWMIPYSLTRPDWIIRRHSWHDIRLDPLPPTLISLLIELVVVYVIPTTTLALVAVYFIPTRTNTNRITAGDNELNTRIDIAR